jgi:hypothetical protein
MGENVLDVFLLVVFILIVLLVGFLTGSCVTSCRNHLHQAVSRSTQRCEIAGRDLDCQRHSAWVIGSQCRCIANGAVVRWTEGE